MRWLIVGCVLLTCAKSHPQASETPAAPVPPTPTIAFDKSVSEAIEATNGGIVEAAVADGRLWLRTRSGVMAVRFADGGMEEHFPLGIVDLHRTTDGQLWILGAQKDGNAVLERWNGAWTDAVRVPMDNPIAMGEVGGDLYVVSTHELTRAPDWKTVKLSTPLHAREAEVVSAGTADGRAVFVGTSAMLARVDVQDGHVSTLANRHATALVRDQGACVFAADGHEVVSVCGDRNDIVMGSNDPFSSLAQTSAGLFACSGRIIVAYPGRQVRPVPHFRRTGGVWIGSLPGLLVIPADDGILLAPL